MILITGASGTMKSIQNSSEQSSMLVYLYQIHPVYGHTIDKTIALTNLFLIFIIFESKWTKWKRKK